MLVLTVDQIDSTHHDDRVEATVRHLTHRYGRRLVASPERTAGDEFQLATASGDAALEIALDLVRAEVWRVGIGIGDVRRPLAPNVRAMSGSAFAHARDAVTLAKKRPMRLAVVADDTTAISFDPLVRLLLALRERRTAEGWELSDLLEGEPRLTLTDAASRLGISVQAASQRALTAALKLDREAREALGAMLTRESERIEG